jgi:DNA-directed RNA polymerase specialized sigma24 family protein
MTSPLAQAVPDIGIVTKVAVKHWRRFPQHIRNAYDLEDLVSEIVAKLVVESPRWDSTRGQASTFVWTLAENICKSIATAYLSQKRKHYPVELKEVRRNSSIAMDVHWMESRRDFEALLRDASEELRDTLGTFIEQRPKRGHGFNEPMLEELQQLVKKHHISREAMQLLLHRV